jgi:hypothetical protein
MFGTVLAVYGFQNSEDAILNNYNVHTSNMARPEFWNRALESARITKQVGELVSPKFDSHNAVIGWWAVHYTV